ncbi:MAG TPA: regulatory protein RecX [Steroidobacteraceae bacterium]|nr:regulatory protein RecX [Steroidobacteraceae bacterium]
MRRRFKAGAPAATPAPDPLGARLAAVTLLARRDFASGELAARLRQDGYPAEGVAAVIADLTAGRILDDTRFATQYVAYHAQRGQGPRRIAMDLSARGVAPAQIEAAMAAGTDWAALAREVRIRRFGLSLPQTWAEKAKQGRFLQYRGFSSDHIRSALGPDFESEDLL